MNCVRTIVCMLNILSLISNCSIRTINLHLSLSVVRSQITPSTFQSRYWVSQNQVSVHIDLPNCLLQYIFKTLLHCVSRVSFLNCVEYLLLLNSNAVCKCSCCHATLVFKLWNVIKLFSCQIKGNILRNIQRNISILVMTSSMFVLVQILVN